MYARWRVIWEALFPPLCAACGMFLDKNEGAVCTSCLSRIPCLGWVSCPHCGARIAPGAPRCHPEALYALIAATSYSSPEAQRMVKALKYDGMEHLASTLALFIAATAASSLEHELLTPASPAGRRDDWVMVPIPLHPKRERERGFNQSALLAEALSHHRPFIAFPVTGALLRIRNTGTQTERPDYRARRTNVSGCFAVSDDAAIYGKNVLLIDDVSTSGATLEEAAHVLKRAGAGCIVGLVFAKA